MILIRFEKALYTISSISLALIIWQIVAFILNIAYIPSPVAVGIAIVRLSVEGDFLDIHYFIIPLQV